MIGLLIAMILAPGQPPHLRVAEKALAGDYGPLSDWQRDGYEALLAQSPNAKLAWITHYAREECALQWDPMTGKKEPHAASGLVPKIGLSAAMLGVPIPRWKFDKCTRSMIRRDQVPWSYVLVDLPTGMTLRRVEDTGSRANRGKALSFGATEWVDLYAGHGLRNVTHIRRVWVVTR